MSARWIVLGAGTILPRVGFGAAGHALCPTDDGPVTLFDCGPGTVRSLAAAGLALERIERVAISHFHTDHVLDLFALAFARRNPRLQGAPPVEVVGPLGLEALLRESGPLGKRAGVDAFELCEVDPDADAVVRVERGDLTLCCTRNGHVAEALSWRADLAGGASVTYSGDADDDPRIAALAKGCDLFVCECAGTDARPVPKHLTPSTAGRLARRAGCARLVLTHCYPDVDPQQAALDASEAFGGPVEWARDGSSFRVG